MQVDFKTDKLNPCRCGFKPDHYTVGYGRTPYDVFCPNCKKQTTLAKCKISGSVYNLFDYWNNHIAKLTLEELNQEVEEFNKEKQNLEERPRRYFYYWVKGKGESLIEEY